MTPGIVVSSVRGKESDNIHLLFQVARILLFADSTYRPTTTPRQGQEEVHNQPEGVPHQDFEVGFDVDNFVEENPLTIKHQHTFTCNFVVLRFVASIEANSVHVSGHCQS